MCITLFLYISLPSLHDLDVKMPNFMFYGGRKQATTNFSFSPKLEWGPQELNSREIRRIRINTTKFKKRDFVFAAVTVVDAKAR